MATTLNGLENQTKVITMNALGEYDNLRPQVKPVEATHAQMVAMRDQGKLIPGQLYRITNYVTTVNELTITDARSAGHPFDIIVMALDATTLSEEAWAIQHDGDEYFANSNLAAWKLRYTLDNIQWSKRVCAVVTEKIDGFNLLSIGPVEIDGETYILWDASELEEDYGFNRMVSLTMEVGAEMWQYDAETNTIVEDGYTTSIDTIVGEITENGSGTITYMKDEFNNECPYDFKNIQFKRYMTTDSMSGRTDFDGFYMSAGGSAAEIEFDADDFIWAFTFSSDPSGGEQTDYSLGGYKVYDNVVKASDVLLPNNVFFGNVIFGNFFGLNCTYNTAKRSFGNNCLLNGCKYNSFGDNCYNNTIKAYSESNTFGKGTSGNTFGSTFRSNCCGESFSSNSIGNACSNSKFEKGFVGNTIFDNVSGVTVPNSYVTNVQVLPGIRNVTLNFQGSASYTRVAAKTSAGVLKIYVPGDLA